jgi:acyl carrier protein
MLSKSEVMALMQESIDSLKRSGVIETPLPISDTAVLLGQDSSLDSMGFVTFITDVEERLNRKTGKDVYIVLTDLEEKYPGAPQLSGAMFADYLVSLAAS